MAASGSSSRSRRAVGEASGGSDTPEPLGLVGGEARVAAGAGEHGHARPAPEALRRRAPGTASALASSSSSCRSRAWAAPASSTRASNTRWSPATAPVCAAAAVAPAAEVPTLSRATPTSRSAQSGQRLAQPRAVAVGLQVERDRAHPVLERERREPVGGVEGHGVAAGDDGVEAQAAAHARARSRPRCRSGRRAPPARARARPARPPTAGPAREGPRCRCRWARTRGDRDGGPPRAAGPPARPRRRPPRRAAGCRAPPRRRSRRSPRRRPPPRRIRAHPPPPPRRARPPRGWPPPRRRAPTGSSASERKAGEAMGLGTARVHPPDLARVAGRRQVQQRLAGVGPVPLRGADDRDGAGVQQPPQVHISAAYAPPRGARARAR